MNRPALDDLRRSVLYRKADSPERLRMMLRLAPLRELLQAGEVLNMKTAQDYTGYSRYRLMTLLAQGKIRAIRRGDGVTAHLLFLPEDLSGIYSGFQGA